MFMTSKISRIGLFSFVAFFFLNLSVRFLYPFGDEPDWTVRAARVVGGDHHWFSPYYLFSGLLESYQINSSACVVEASAMSLWAYVPAGCSESLDQIALRFSLTIFILLPIFFAIIFRQSFIKIMTRFNYRLTLEEWHKRLNVMSVAILLPGMLYYLGVLAEEQFFLVVSLFIYLFWGFVSLIVPILVLLVLTDFGNTIVVVYFIFSYLLFKALFRVFGKKGMFTIFFIGLLFSLTVGHYFLNTIASFSNMFGLGDVAHKADAIYESLDGSEYLAKYPVILRPVITLMTMVFMLPSGLKSVAAYLLFLLMLLVLILYNKRHHFLVDKSDIVLVVAAGFVVLSIVFMFPTYGNAKYYMFLVPFVLNSILSPANKNIAISLMVFISFLVVVNLLLFRI